MKKELNHEYTALCSKQNLVTEYLFGDNIREQLKTITETNKIGLKVRPQKQFSQYHFDPMTKRRGLFYSTGLPRRTNI